MTDLKLSFGCNKALPEGVTTAWGARLIWPNDLVWDRQDLKGPNADALKAWLNAGALARALAIAPSLPLGSADDLTMTIYEDETGVIVGNPQGSHGYLYVAAWLKADVPELHVVVESHWRGERWEGEVPPAPQGQTTLGYLFRFFNRVDDGDGERLEAIGYTLPSLSVDDHVIVFGKRWRCENIGWELGDDDGNPHAA